MALDARHRNASTYGGVIFARRQDMSQEVRKDAGEQLVSVLSNASSYRERLYSPLDRVPPIAVVTQYGSEGEVIRIGIIMLDVFV